MNNPYPRKNPCKINPPSGDAEEEKRRKKMGISIFDTKLFESVVGYVRPEVYARPAMNVYQARVRGDAKEVSLHYTKHFKERIVEL